MVNRACRREMNYPAFYGERLRLDDAVSRGGGTVGCRWFGTFVTDESGRLPILGIHGAKPACGDWVSGRLVPEGLGWVLSEAVIHANNRLGDGVPEDWVLEQKGVLEARQKMYRRIRNYFETNGFLEVETPYRVLCPAVEPHLNAISAEGRFLITSPELHMKRLLGRGFEKIYQIARVFRGNEAGPLHLEEFTLLEWYRAWSTPERLMKDCEGLVKGLSEEVGLRRVSESFERISYRELFLNVTGLDPFGWLEDPAHAAQLRSLAQTRGFQFIGSETMSEVVDGIFAVMVEPGLKDKGAVFVHGYPAWAAVLSRVHENGNAMVADRFELYLDGIEIGNAYHEETDPDINRERLRSAEMERVAQGKECYPRDEGFLAVLDAGMPPASGIALGLDRLLMWLLDLKDISQTVAFRDKAMEPGKF